MRTIDTQSLAFLLADCARLMRSGFERKIAAAGLGLTAGEARTLLQVAAFNGSRQLDIATRMSLEPMTVSAFLDKLQARGLIERQADPSDRRAKRIVLSDTADDMLDAIKAEISSLQDIALAGFDGEQHAALNEALKNLRKNIQGSDTPES